jgi:adenine-specific DNA-methyltransferase
MEKLRMESIDLTQKNIEKIGTLFPNVITEKRDENGNLKKGINFELLKQELSGVVVDGEECYDFTWVGKKAAIVEGNTPIRKTLRPCIEESKDWESTGNLYIEGDNLDVLKLLQESYLNSIKMIYIDIITTKTIQFNYPDLKAS